MTNQQSPQTLQGYVRAELTRGRPDMTRWRSTYFVFYGEVRCRGVQGDRTGLRLARRLSGA